MLAQVAYFLKKYGEGSKNAKEETAVDNNMEDGQVAKEEENVESGEKEVKLSIGFFFIIR